MKRILSIKKLKNSFKYAFRGLKLIFKKERNVYLFLIISIISIIAGFILQISSIEWCFIIILIGLVYAFEFLNSFVEMLLDIVNKSYNNKVKDIKDVFAASTLIMSVVAAIIALIIFIPKIIKLIGELLWLKI